MAVIKGEAYVRRVWRYKSIQWEEKNVVVVCCCPYEFNLKQLIGLPFLPEQEEWVSTAIVIVVVTVVKLDWVTLLSLSFLSQQFLSSDPQILFEQHCVPAVRLPHSEEDVARDGDKASSDADGGVEDHLGLEPVWDVGFTGLADNEVVVEVGVGDGADDGDKGDEECPSEADAAEVETFVQMVRAGLDGFEDFSVVLG